MPATTRGYYMVKFAHPGSKPRTRAITAAKRHEKEKKGKRKKKIKKKKSLKT